MAINKVQFGNTTLMDITDTTASTEDVLEGEVFYAKDGTRSVGSLGDATQSTHGLMSSNDKIKLDGISTMVGATSSANGSSGLVPAPTTADRNKFLAGDGTYKNSGTPVILSYGKSTWNDFITAYRNNVLIYCRASSNANPSIGNQTRLASMVYVNNTESPTTAEFQYYRSIRTHSSTQLCDQIFVYELYSSGTWSVTTREVGIKTIYNNTNSFLDFSYSDNALYVTKNQPLGLSYGGTAAITAAGARTNLGVYSTTQTDNAISQSIANLFSTETVTTTTDATGNIQLSSTVSNGIFITAYTVNTPSAMLTPFKTSDGLTYIKALRSDVTEFTPLTNTELTYTVVYKPA